MHGGFSGPIPLGSFDRSQLSIVQRYAASGLAPHVQVTRWTYTVPTGRVAAVEMLAAFQTRSTVATSGPWAGFLFFLTIAAGGSGYFLSKDMLLNTVGASSEWTAGSELHLLAGDAIDGETFDISTGGAFDLNVSMKASEFNA